MVVFLFIWVLKEYKKVIIHILNNFSQFLAGFSYQIQNRSQILVYLDYLYMTLCNICSNWRFLLLFPIHQTGLCQLFIESQSIFFLLWSKSFPEKTEFFSVKRVCSGHDDFHFPDRCLPLIPLYKMLGHSLSTTRPSQRWIFSRFPCFPFMSTNPLIKKALWVQITIFPKSLHHI